MEAINKVNIIKKEVLQKKLNLNFKDKIVLISYHPETLEKTNNNKNFNKFLKALKTLKDLTLVFTMPNADIGYKNITKGISKFVLKNKNSILVKSLGHEQYFSLCRHIDLMIGNSSSGIIEMPSFKKPSINVGIRQREGLGLCQ